MLDLGKYRHYKGGLYELISEARHSESGEHLVVYRSLYDNPDFPAGSVWVRPYEQFVEKVEIEGGYVDRFRLER